jgi:hypothetical protein
MDKPAKPEDHPHNTEQEVLERTNNIFSESESESESYVTTNDQSASLSWNKSPIWGLRPNTFLLMSDSCRFVDMVRSL